MGIWAWFGMECIENRSATKKLSEKSLTAQFQELNAPKMVFSFSLAAEQIWLTFGVRLLPSRSRCTGWNSNTNTWKDQEYKESRFDWLKQDSKSVTIMEVWEAKGKTRRKRFRPSKKTSSSHDPASNATRALHCRCHLSVFFFAICFRKLFWLCQQCDGDCKSEWNLCATVGALDCGGVLPKVVARRGLRRRRIPSWSHSWFSDRGRLFSSNSHLAARPASQRQAPEQKKTLVLINHNIQRQDFYRNLRRRRWLIRRREVGFHNARDPLLCHRALAIFIFSSTRLRLLVYRQQGELLSSSLQKFASIEIPRTKNG